MKRKATLFITLLAAALTTLSAGPAAAKLTDDQKIVHLLNRISFGPRPGDIDRVRKLGIDKYIDEQLHPERIDDSRTDALLAAFPSIKMDVGELNQNYVTPSNVARELGLIAAKKQQQPTNDTPQDQQAVRQQVQAIMRQKNLKPQQNLLRELQGQKLVRAVSSERQLQEVMTDFWFNHFNVFWGKGADKQLTTDYEVSAIRPHVLGKFKDLVMATARHPAMLFYLDNAQSSSPDTQTQAEERLTRLQQQFGRNPRAQARIQNQIEQIKQRTAQQKRARKPGINENYARELMELHTMGVDGGYTQKDVQEVARAFTGWTIDRPRAGGGFIFRDAMHDRGEKTVLGHRINAGGVRDGEEVIDILVHHPSTARFIATKLVRRFVSDEPPDALVERVAAVYKKTDGDIREMLQTIFSSEEFYSVTAYRAKTKSPFELAVSSIRAVDGKTDGSPRLAQLVTRMGQPLYQYQAPTGFPDRASQWTSSGSLVERLNFGVSYIANRIQGTPADITRFSGESLEPAAAVDRAVNVLLAGDVSDQTKRIVLDQVQSSTEPPLARAFALVLGSPEFQRR